MEDEGSSCFFFAGGLPSVAGAIIKMNMTTVVQIAGRNVISLGEVRAAMCQSTVVNAPRSVESMSIK